MIKNLRYIFCGLFITSIMASMSFGATPATQRTATSSAARASGTSASGARVTVQPIVLQRGTVSRDARTMAKRASVTPNRSATTANSISRAGNIISNAGNAIIRRAFGMSRSATPTTTARTSTGVRNARSAVQMGGASRARATAVFGDISKLGDGYNQCRDAYNTCMDQFCAGANETYRRCYCSNNYRDFRDREDALDAATTLLAQFENNNLNAVNLSAEEVNAMYTATAGEQAIKNDTSGAAELLSNIDDLLSGKKKATDTKNSLSSLTGMSIDFSTDFGDIWGAPSTSLFNDSSAADLSTMDGVELYNNAHTQCMQLVGETCDAGAMRNMAKSAYSILITQDCNAYQKKIDAKAEQIKTTVRTAEKYLREARLEEYRSHNSADVNECLDRVESAMTQPTACGSDYAKCLDYTGVYINSSSGEPIYSPRLFKLNELINLNGTSADVLAQNPDFNKFLDSKRVYARTALESCRDLADTVWSEFKRNALIKISQAQDEKIEEVKMSCVSTMKDCYDTQSDALKSFDDTTAQASGALAARASRDMCSDKVLACAALYARDGAEVCKVDARGKITNASTCGLASLTNFVGTVDDVRIAEGCGTAVENYLKQICTPSTGTEGYPWNCRLREFGNLNGNHSWSDSAQNSGKDLVSMVINYAIDNCGVGTDGKLETRSQNEVIQQLENLREELGDLIGEKCEMADGIWVDADDTDSTGLSDGTVIDSFYSVNFGKSHTQAQSDYGVDTWGKCIRNSVKARCDAENKRTGNNGYATYDASTGQCNLTIEYYKYQCEQVLGIWADDNNCYIEK